MVFKHLLQKSDVVAKFVHDMEILKKMFSIIIDMSYNDFYINTPLGLQNFSWKNANRAHFKVLFLKNRRTIIQ